MICILKIVIYYYPGITIHVYCNTLDILLVLANSGLANVIATPWIWTYTEEHVEIKSLNKIQDRN